MNVRKEIVFQSLGEFYQGERRREDGKEESKDEARMFLREKRRRMEEV